MSFPHRHKFLFGVIISIGVLIYVAFNVWVYRSAKSGKVLKGDSLPFEAQGKPQGVTLSNSSPAPTSPAKSREAGSGFAGQDLAPPDTPTPRLTGPGRFACSPEGDCNVYSDEVRQRYCTTTYADSLCLDQCGDKAIQCTK